VVTRHSLMPIKEVIINDPDLTLFQKKVLLAAMEIPKGETGTYKWIAAKAGYPGAARAAGQALKKNPYAPEVPCHRVVRSDGSIGGYSAIGGIRRKKKLLLNEGCKYRT